MTKRAIIEILLIPESLGKRSTEIEDEILKEFHEGRSMIPWASQIAKIRVVETWHIPERENYRKNLPSHRRENQEKKRSGQRTFAQVTDHNFPLRMITTRDPLSETVS